MQLNPNGQLVFENKQHDMMNCIGISIETLKVYNFQIRFRWRRFRYFDSDLAVVCFLWPACQLTLVQEMIPKTGSRYSYIRQQSPFWYAKHDHHYNNVIMGAAASQITSLTVVYPTVHSGADQRKHQSSASLVFVWGIHRRPVNSPHKGPLTRKMFPFDDVIMNDKHTESPGLPWWQLSSRQPQMLRRGWHYDCGFQYMPKYFLSLTKLVWITM